VTAPFWESPDSGTSFITRNNSPPSVRQQKTALASTHRYGHNTAFVRDDLDAFSDAGQKS
jgi:hypothetical protein